MNHCGTQTIETNRLILRRFEVSDAEVMYRNWASSPAVAKFLTWAPHKDEEETRALLTEWVVAYEKPDCYNWIIVLKGEKEEPVGSISVVALREETETAAIGYCIGQAWWHRGITSEALGAVIDYLFEQVGFNRIEATHDIDNPHSGGVMEKCGMRREGILRQYARNNQGICDSCIHAILKEDLRKA